MAEPIQVLKAHVLRLDLHACLRRLRKHPDGVPFVSGGTVSEQSRSVVGRLFFMVPPVFDVAVLLPVSAALGRPVSAVGNQCTQAIARASVTRTEPHV